MVATGEEEDQSSSVTLNRAAQLRHVRYRPHGPEHRSAPYLDPSEEVLTVHLLLAFGGSNAERLDHLPPTSSSRDSDQLHQIQRPAPPGTDNEATVGTSKYRLCSASCSSGHPLRCDEHSGRSSRQARRGRRRESSRAIRRLAAANARFPCA